MGHGSDLSFLSDDVPYYGPVTDELAGGPQAGALGGGLDREEPRKFGRLFPASDYAPSNEALAALAQTMLEQDPGPAGDNVPVPAEDHPGMPSGHAFLGQFIDHDITFDPISRLGQGSPSQANFRSPSLDLDNVYGGGPDASRHLYDVVDPASLGGRLPVRLLVPPSRSFDLPRNEQRQALIGDPRNDENHFVSQVHRRFLGFHNTVVGDVIAEGALTDPRDQFDEARKRVTQHYHAMVRDDFLPRLVRRDVLDEVLSQDEPRVYTWTLAPQRFMPVEFSVAAYRMGHSLIRNGYVLNRGRTSGLFDLPPFDQRTTLDALDWDYFVGTAQTVQYARKVDEHVVEALFHLPFIATSPSEPASLPERNLRRGVDARLPAGQDVATEIRRRVPAGLGPEVLSNEQLGVGNIAGLDGKAPLWFYVLRESGRNEGGRTLGHVGSWIVAEVIVELMKAWPESPLNDPSWQPSYGQDGRFTFADLVSLGA